MQLVIQKGGIVNPPETITGVDKVFLKTDAGTLAMVAMDMQGNVLVSTVTDDDFNDALAMVGVEEIQPIDVVTLPEVKQ